MELWRCGGVGGGEEVWTPQCGGVELWSLGGVEAKRSVSSLWCLVHLQHL